jgi:hypothetical protein
MFYSWSEKTNTINLLLKNNSNNKYCKWGHFVVSPDFNSVNDSPKALNYRIYKDNLVFENYLNILNDKDNLTLSKFRTTNHKLQSKMVDGKT